jgi:hypothetical protein
MQDHPNENERVLGWLAETRAQVWLGLGRLASSKRRPRRAVRHIAMDDRARRRPCTRIKGQKARPAAACGLRTYGRWSPLGVGDPHHNAGCPRLRVRRFDQSRAEREARTRLCRRMHPWRARASRRRRATPTLWAAHGALCFLPRSRLALAPAPVYLVWSLTCLSYRRFVCAGLGLIGWLASTRAFFFLLFSSQLLCPTC